MGTPVVSIFLFLVFGIGQTSNFDNLASERCSKLHNNAKVVNEHMTLNDYQRFHLQGRLQD